VFNHVHPKTLELLKFFNFNHYYLLRNANQHKSNSDRSTFLPITQHRLVVNAQHISRCTFHCTDPYLWSAFTIIVDFVPFAHLNEYDTDDVVVASQNLTFIFFSCISSKYIGSIHEAIVNNIYESRRSCDRFSARNYFGSHVEINRSLLEFPTYVAVYFVCLAYTSLSILFRSGHSVYVRRTISIPIFFFRGTTARHGSLYTACNSSNDVNVSYL
jgi:hypothetical protein